MISPAKITARSPLKAADTNSRVPRNSLSINTDGSANLANTKVSGVDTGNLMLKKRSLEKLEQQQIQDKKRPKIERGRSIEGAIVQVSKALSLKNAEQDNQNHHQAKVTPNELLEWQNNWKKIMRRESRIYFDTTDETDISKHARLKLDKKKELLKRGFISLGAQITQFFDTSVTIVITRRSVDRISSLQDNDVLSRAKKGYMKVWNYEKSTRFLKNLNVDLDQLEKEKLNSLSTPTLSNLLQNEKLYGPSDRDPRTRRDDIHYFKYSSVYLYDLWQTWAPVITLEWKPQELMDVNNLPYPVLKMGTFGRCPFIGDGSCDESSYKRVAKRYNRDKANRSYALRLRQLYQYHSEPSPDRTEFLLIPHTCLDSKHCYEKWQQKLNSHQTALSNNEAKVSEITVPKTKLSKVDENTSWKEPIKVPEKTLSNISLSHQQLLGTMIRQETEEFPNDLCNSKNLNWVAQEIKASGVHQSNDVATSFGNGLGPTKASVLSKNLKSLNRMVVDRRLGTKANTTSSASKIISKINNDEKEQSQSNASRINSTNTTTDNDNKDKDKDIKNTNKGVNVNLDKEAGTKKEIEKPVVRNSGYCENCRVKYDSLDLHVKSERHQSFAQNDLNFESIDSLISKLKFQF
ncbi:hypothetical protein Kpol_1065p47 [Vanderwaltozyma polyspora DSM 70294]|uniref:DBF4-type domain-containing protein n=1 Tax=Vanderwaltozyma polyspora (strain ATCC 22028 / DSM 70294 / BCRC 21397 / CBS 2163 / NBRC 10782 / NRRL Y-8283 / UCD 57-17) TaxID=436907 RepID=A7TL67_VANPO|nr:uncharacterized protein Kpol_1065p47 [Vanderwaltozyma polyspora DSM 70294]EDO17030.1 hypothetical protein Kpol_1065p47 [Vanderwaltozyma polyspora DSM 70294]